MRFKLIHLQERGRGRDRTQGAAVIRGSCSYCSLKHTMMREDANGYFGIIGIIFSCFSIAI